ncbi:MAG TPA: class D sortase [Coriobacteriia bacterium]
MPRARHSRGRISLGVAVSLGLLVLGIGGIGCALVNINAESVATADAYRSVPSSPTTPTVAQAGPTEDATAPVVFYARYPSEGEVIGSLSIPALKLKLPIIEGTGADDLKKGVGHVSETVLPGQQDNCVLSGHRDTVFTGLGKLKIGDRFIASTTAGAFTYRISRIRIVHKDDTTIIVPAEHAVLTVSTCYPFHFVGAAPDRYVLIADLVTNE